MAHWHDTSEDRSWPGIPGKKTAKSAAFHEDGREDLQGPCAAALQLLRLHSHCYIDCGISRARPLYCVSFDGLAASIRDNQCLAVCDHHELHRAHASHRNQYVSSGILAGIALCPYVWGIVTRMSSQPLPQPLLQVEGVTLQYETGQRWVRAAYRVSFNVYRSDRYVILGPSGCGKSTLLKSVGGYVQPVEGRILLDGKAIHAPGPDRVFIFQEFDQLLPWKTVEANIVFALTAAGKYRRTEAIERARFFLSKVNLSKFAGSYPHTLSGGMKQRAAIARALAMEPQMLLMDEPFAALDALTRVRMQEELIELCGETKATILFVTHSIPEAIRVGNRILLMSAHPGQVKAELHSPGAAESDTASKVLASRIEKVLFEPKSGEGRTHV